MSDTQPPGEVRCYLCKKPCDGRDHDIYGEWMLNRSDLVVCGECADDLEHEDGPWNEVR